MSNDAARRVLIYEWVTGGGLVGTEGALPDSLLREGAAMAQACAADAAAAGDLHPVLLRDLRVTTLYASGGEVIEVASRQEHDAVLAEQAASADAVLVIAPEIDGALLQVVRRLVNQGARLISPGVEFVEIAADKQRTVDVLTSADVPVPVGMILESDAPLPVEFAYPAVVKPLDGAGSQDTHAVAHAGDRPPAYAWPRRLERFAPGLPVSVAAVGVAGGELVLLPPVRQRISSEGRFRYLGGAGPLPPGLAERAQQLASRTFAALPSLVGYAGVDLVLGDDPDGSLDVVIEVNPRLTTSFIGLRHAAGGGLVAAMIDAAAGQTPSLSFNPRPLAWDTEGAVYWE